jgi:hypothetical protein
MRGIFLLIEFDGVRSGDGVREFERPLFSRNFPFLLSPNTDFSIKFLLNFIHLYRALLPDA